MRQNWDKNGTNPGQNRDEIYRFLCYTGFTTPGSPFFLIRLALRLSSSVLSPSSALPCVLIRLALRAIHLPQRGRLWAALIQNSRTQDLPPGGKVPPKAAEEGESPLLRRWTTLWTKNIIPHPKIFHKLLQFVVDYSGGDTIINAMKPALC